MSYDKTPTDIEIAEALRNLRLGKATSEQQKLASRYLGKQIGALGEELAGLEKSRKQFAKEWRYWRRMEYVYILVNDPTMGGLVSEVDSSSHEEAYKIVAEYDGKAKPVTIRRDYNRLKREYGEEGFAKVIKDNIARLWHEAIRGK